MIAIAIVDSSPVCRSYLQSLVTKYAKQHNEQIDLRVFSDADRFLEYYEHNIDILIIDSELRGNTDISSSADAADYTDIADITQSGIAQSDITRPQSDAGILLAARIRGADDGVDIIFVSTSEIHAILGYQVGAQSFLLKPPQYDTFSTQLHECITQWHTRRNNTVVIASGNNIQRILIDDIIYLSSYNHRTLLHTSTRQIPIVCSLVKFEERVPQKSSLLRVNSGYIVNIKHVKVFQDNTMWMSNGDKVTVSRPRKAAVKEAMRKYYETNIG